MFYYISLAGKVLPFSDLRKYMYVYEQNVWQSYQGLPATIHSPIEWAMGDCIFFSTPTMEGVRSPCNQVSYGLVLSYISADSRERWSDACSNAVVNRSQEEKEHRNECVWVDGWGTRPFRFGGGVVIILTAAHNGTHGVDSENKSTF